MKKTYIKPEVKKVEAVTQIKGLAMACCSKTVTVY